MYALGVKDCDVYLPTEAEVTEMIKASEEHKKQQGPSPDDQAKIAKAKLDEARAAEIQADVQGTSASKQLEGVALIGEHKATAYK